MGDGPCYVPGPLYIRVFAGLDYANYMALVSYMRPWLWEEYNAEALVDLARYKDRCSRYERVITDLESIVEARGQEISRLRVELAAHGRHQ